MRHDEHYVSALAASAGAPVGRMIGIDQVDHSAVQAVLNVCPYPDCLLDMTG